MAYLTARHTALNPADHARSAFAVHANHSFNAPPLADTWMWWADAALALAAALVNLPIMEARVVRQGAMA